MKDDQLENLRKRIEELDKALEENGVKPKSYHDIPRDRDSKESRFDIANCVAKYNNPLNQPFQKSLSFHDIDTNELWLLGLPTESTDPEQVTKANEIFIHTFLNEFS